MKKISISLEDNRSIDKGIHQIQRLIRDIEDFPGFVAQMEYPTAQNMYADNADINDDPITVRVNKQKNSAEIIAEGESVVFNEYGTGFAAKQDADAPVPTGKGTWSSSEDGSKEYAIKGFWYYNGKKYVGTLPSAALRTTAEDIKRDTEKLAQEYFQ